MATLCEDCGGEAGQGPREEAAGEGHHPEAGLHEEIHSGRDRAQVLRHT